MALFAFDHAVATTGGGRADVVGAQVADTCLALAFHKYIDFLESVELESK